MSKNQALSSTSASIRCTTSVRAALKPHWASENFAAMVARSSTLYVREMNSRLGPRTTAEPRCSRLPIARSLWPDSRGATSGRNASSPVDRSTSM